MKACSVALLGLACVVAIACGGARKQSATAPPPAATDGGAMPGMPMAERKGEIEQLEEGIRADLARMGLPEPSPEMAPTCTDCSPVRMTNEITLHGSDATCTPGTSDTCRDSCKLADSICTSAKRICTIAAEMGDDAWASGKCLDGKGSCDRAKTRCCGCQL